MYKLRDFGKRINTNCMISFRAVILAFQKIDSVRTVILYNLYINPFTPDSVKSKTENFSRITNRVKLKNKQHHSKVMLNSFPMNGHTLGFFP